MDIGFWIGKIFILILIGFLIYRFWKDWKSRSQKIVVMPGRLVLAQQALELASAELVGERCEGFRLRQRTFSFDATEERTQTIFCESAAIMKICGTSYPVEVRAEISVRGDDETCNRHLVYVDLWINTDLINVAILKGGYVYNPQNEEVEPSGHPIEKLPPERLRFRCEDSPI